MKITDKEIDKLNQLDRVELLLRLDRVEKMEKDSYCNPLSLLYPLLCIIGFIIVTGILLFQYSADSFTNLLNLIPSITKMFLFIMSIEFVFNLFFIFRFKKLKDELFKKFFKEELVIKDKKK